jgi:hypothetical protein
MSALKNLSIHLDHPYVDRYTSAYPYEVRTSCDHILSNLAVPRLQHLSLHGFETTYTLPEFLQSCSSLRNVELLQLRLEGKSTWTSALAAIRKMIALESLKLDLIQSCDSTWQVFFGPERIHHYVWQSANTCKYMVGPARCWHNHHHCFHTSPTVDDCVNGIEGASVLERD